MAKLTHINAAGEAHMVDVSEKQDTAREAIAQSTIRMSAETFALLTKGDTPKGDVMATARLAGIMGAKKTSELIPLCHPLPISKATVDLDLDPDLPGVTVTATVRTTGKTGVEMEALTAASIATLTLYDMLKASDKGMEITSTRLLKKSGGKSGIWQAQL